MIYRLLVVVPLGLFFCSCQTTSVPRRHVEYRELAGYTREAKGDPVRWAVNQCNEHAVKLFLKYGELPNHKDRDGTPLDLARSLKLTKIEAVLREHGGCTARELAADREIQSKRKARELESLKLGNRRFAQKVDTIHIKQFKHLLAKAKEEKRFPKLCGMVACDSSVAQLHKYHSSVRHTETTPHSWRVHAPAFRSVAEELSHLVANSARAYVKHTEEHGCDGKIALKDLMPPKANNAKAPEHPSDSLAGDLAIVISAVFEVAQHVMLAKRYTVEELLQSVRQEPWWIESDRVKKLINPICRTAPHSPRLQCLSNLKQIGLAMLMYSGENSGFFPPNLMTLDTEKMLPRGKVFYSPMSSKKGRGTNYLYWAAFVRDDMRAGNSMPLACSPLSDCGKWVNVLFAGGHVKSVPSGDFEKRFPRLWSRLSQD